MTECDLADLAVRAARAELERDAAIAREEAALKRVEDAERMVRDLTSKDEQALLDTLHIVGIPAREMRDIYAAVQDWHKTVKHCRCRKDVPEAK